MRLVVLCAFALFFSAIASSKIVAEYIKGQEVQQNSLISSILAGSRKVKMQYRPCYNRSVERGDLDVFNAVLSMLSENQLKSEDIIKAVIECKEDRSAMLAALLEKTKEKKKALTTAINEKSFWAVRYFSKDKDLLLEYVEGKKGWDEDTLLLVMVQPGLKEPMESGDLGRIFFNRNQAFFPFIYLDARCPVKLLDEASKTKKNTPLLEAIRLIKTGKSADIAKDPGPADSKLLALCAASCNQPDALKRFYNIWAKGTKKAKPKLEQKLKFLDQVIRLSIYSSNLDVLSFAWQELKELNADLKVADQAFLAAHESFKNGDKTLDLETKRDEVDQAIIKYFNNSLKYPYCQYLAKVHQNYYWRALRNAHAAPSGVTDEILMAIFRKYLGDVQKDYSLHYGKVCFDGEALIEDEDDAVVGVEGDGKGDGADGNGKADSSSGSGSDEDEDEGEDSDEKSEDKVKENEGNDGGDVPKGKRDGKTKVETGAEGTTTTTSTTTASSANSAAGTKGKGKKGKTTSASAATAPATTSTASTQAGNATAAAATTTTDATTQPTDEKSNLLYYIIAAVVGVVVVGGLLAAYFLLRTKDTPDLQDPVEQDGEEQEEFQKKGRPQNLA